jgi:hypothetical protein
LGPPFSGLGHAAIARNAPLPLSIPSRVVFGPSGHANSPIPFNLIPCYPFSVAVHLTPKGASNMEWVTPQHEEINLSCEVSSYANAEL